MVKKHISSFTSFIIPLLLTFSVGLTGCFGKPFTKPYSQVVEEAQRDGRPMPTIEENHKQFLEIDKRHSDKLRALLESRGLESRGLESNNLQSKELKGKSKHDNNTGEYRIGPRDKIDIHVFDIPELNLVVPVDDAGVMALPLVGSVRAADLTEQELRDAIASSLKPFVKSPQVTVTILEFGSQRVSVLGAVGKAGTISLRKGVNSLVEILGEVGGPTDKAGPYINFIPVEASGLKPDMDPSARALLAINPQNKDLAIEIALDRIYGGSGQVPLDIPVRGGDIIIVPEAGKVAIDGEVAKQGVYDVGYKMSVLGALGAAGGITYSAKVDEVELIREVGPENVKARLNLNLERIASGEQKDVLIRAGDIIRVPSDSYRKMTSDTFDNITKVINFGIGGNIPLSGQ